MAARILRTRASREDYAEIWDFIARDNPDAADHLLASFDQKLELIAASPGLGQPQEHLSPGLRRVVVGNYLIFYRQSDRGIELIRVLHAARNYPEIFIDQ